MSAPTLTPCSLQTVACVSMGRNGKIKRIDIQSTADVSALLAWCSMPMTHAGTRRHVLDAVLGWITDWESDMLRKQQEQADRERGCVALLMDAAQRIGEVERA